MKKLYTDNEITKNPHVLMIVYSVLVSLSFLVGHAITNDIDPVALTFARFFLGTIIFGVLVAIKYEIKKPTLFDLIRYTAISASLVGYFLAMFYALRYTTSSNAGVIYTLVPLFTAVYGMVFLKEFPKASKLGILLFTMCGSIWVVAGGSVEKLIHFSFNIGDVIFICGCMSMGLYPVLSKWLSRGEPTPVMTFWTLCTGAGILFAAGCLRIFNTDWLHLPARVYLGLGYITVFTTMITFFIVQYASRRMQVSKVMGYIYIVPVFVLADNFIFGYGLPELSVLPGALIAAAGTFYFMRER